MNDASRGITGFCYGNPWAEQQSATPAARVVHQPELRSGRLVQLLLPTAATFKAGPVSRPRARKALWDKIPVLLACSLGADPHSLLERCGAGMWSVGVQGGWWWLAVLKAQDLAAAQVPNRPAKIHHSLVSI